MMLLVGMAGVGKSTLLRTAVEEKNFALFGERYAPYFTRTKVPRSFPEDTLRLTDRISQGTWLHEIDVITLRGRELPLSSAVVHFELFWALWLEHLAAASFSRSEAECRQFFRNEDRMSDHFLGILASRPLASSEVVVEVLQPEYAVALARFKSREAALNRMRRNATVSLCSSLVYDGSSSGKAVYDSIYSAWMSAWTRWVARQDGENRIGGGVSD